MSAVLTLARRDFLSLVVTPAGSIVVALFLFLAGSAFARITFQQGEPANLRTVMEFAGWALLAVAPAVSMRAFSEETRAGTLEVLMTSPMTDVQIVLGKYVAGMLFLMLMLAPTALFALVIEMHGRPDYGELVSGYLGLLLTGSAYLAAGIFASTLTSSQAVAYLLTLFFWVSVSIAVAFLPQVLPPEWADVLFALNHAKRLREFTIGLVDTGNIAYFAAVTAMFLGASTVSLMVRRAR